MEGEFSPWVSWKRSYRGFFWAGAKVSFFSSVVLLRSSSTWLRAKLSVAALARVSVTVVVVWAVVVSSTLAGASLACRAALSWPKNIVKSEALKVSQNSNWAVLCKRFFTREISLAPGSSTEIRPELPNFLISGLVTPNLSIRLRNTSKAEEMDSSTFLLMIGCTWELLICGVICELRVLLPKMSAEANLAPVASKASKKRSI